MERIQVMRDRNETYPLQRVSKSRRVCWLNIPDSVFRVIKALNSKTDLPYSINAPAASGSKSRGQTVRLLYNAI